MWYKEDLAIIFSESSNCIVVSSLAYLIEQFVAGLFIGLCWLWALQDIDFKEKVNDFMTLMPFPIVLMAQVKCNAVKYIKPDLISAHQSWL